MGMHNKPFSLNYAIVTSEKMVHLCIVKIDIQPTRDGS